MLVSILYVPARYNTIYFDPAQKKRRADLFNFEYEFSQLLSALQSKRDRVVVVSGLRRTGKTSLMKAAVNEAKVKHIWLDGRNFETREQFFTVFFEQLGALESIKIENFSAYGVKVALKGSAEQLLKKQKGLVIAIDEVQNLLPLKLDKFVAYLYDNFDVKIMVSGSEIGVLENFIGKNDSKAPLYGRAMVEIKTRRLNRDESARFLIEGNRECGMNIKETEIEKVVSELDGIIGWLTLYGCERQRLPMARALEKVIATGEKLVKGELDNFLVLRRARKKYLEILKILSNGEAGWGEIKRRLGKKFSREISDKQLSLYLSSLLDYGFIEKKRKIQHCRSVVGKTILLKIG